MNIPCDALSMKDILTRPSSRIDAVGLCVEGKDVYILDSSGYVYKNGEQRDDLGKATSILKFLGFDQSYLSWTTIRLTLLHQLTLCSSLCHHFCSWNSCCQRHCICAGHLWICLQKWRRSVWICTKCHHWSRSNSRKVKLILRLENNLQDIVHENWSCHCESVSWSHFNFFHFNPNFKTNSSL